MKKGQIVEGFIEKVEFPNKGILHIEGEEKTVVVKNALPGQKVSVMLQKVRKGKAEGRIVEVLQPAPAEIPSSCPHFAMCGGCTYQNLPYEEQLKLKEAQVKELLDEACITDYEWEGIKASPVQFAYRNKMEFSFGDEYKDGPLSLGMHKRGSFHDIVNVEQCQIVDEDFRMILKATLEFFKKEKVPYYHRMRHTGVLRHLLVRKAVRTGEILVDLVTTRESEVADKQWAEVLLSLPLEGEIAGILHTYNDSVADVVKDEGTEILYGQDYFYEELLDSNSRFRHFHFSKPTL